jgi:hypothetical protein
MTGLAILQTTSMALVCALALLFAVQSCSPSRLHQGATAFGLNALIRSSSLSLSVEFDIACHYKFFLVWLAHVV